MFIKKELGNPDRYKLCCLMIFEADWQLLLKWHSFYGFLPVEAEQTRMLTPNQGSGDKGQSTIDQALLPVAESKLTALIWWSKPVIIWHADNTVQLMITYDSMPRPTNSWNTIFYTNLGFPMATICLHITHGTVQTKVQPMWHYAILPCQTPWLTLITPKSSQASFMTQLSPSWSQKV